MLPRNKFDTLRRELIFVACAYLDACSARGSVQGADAIGDTEEGLSNEILDVVRKDKGQQLRGAARESSAVRREEL